MTLQTARSPRGDVIVRRNECYNPRIASQTGWENLWFGAGGTGTDSVQGTELHKTWSNTPTDMQDAGWSYQHSGWAGSYTQKTASAYVYPTGFEPKFAVKAAYYNKDGGLIRQDTGDTFQLYKTLGWQRVSGTFTCPPGTVYTKVRFVCMSGNNAQVNQALGLQRVLIEPGAVVYDYFDGTTYSAGNGSQHTGWDGAADNSQSLLYDWDPKTLVKPTLVMGYQGGQTSRNVVHQLIDGNVIAALLPSTTRSGTLRMFFDNPADADTARWAHSTAGVWNYTDTDNPAESMTYVVDGTVLKTQSDNRKRWTLEVPYRELS